MDSARVPAPASTGTTDGLAWAVYRGDAPAAGVVVLHGADSVGANHADFARVCVEHGLAALVFDARGHGAGDGPMDGRAIRDVAVMADVLRAEAGVEAVGLRGSSMGGYFALVAARAARAGAVVAICPASNEGLAVGLRAGWFKFAVDREPLVALLRAHDEAEAAARLEVPLLLVHAEGDEVIPVQVSRDLAARAPGAELLVVPGGNHRSAQHDPALQARTAAFLATALQRCQAP